ncbi:AAA domain-containing protein [Bacillota bacterium Meth-B3]
MDKESRKKELPKLPGRLGEFIQALDAERSAVEKNGDSLGFLLSGGERINDSNGSYLYQFRIDYSTNTPDDAPCRLIVGGKFYNAVIVSYDGSYIILATKELISGGIGNAKLEIGSTILYEKMIERIAANADVNNPTGRRLFGEMAVTRVRPDPGLSIPDDGDSNEALRPAQIDAVRSSLTNNLTFIWGPPGTGKTKVISSVIYQLYNSGRTVLLASHTNVAVDNALERVCIQFSRVNIPIEDTVLRFGNHSKELSEGYPGITIKSHIEKLGRSLFSEKLKIEQAINEWDHELTHCHWRLNYPEKRDKIVKAHSSLNSARDLMNSLRIDINTMLTQKSNLENSLSQCAPYMQAKFYADDLELTLNNLYVRFGDIERQQSYVQKRLEDVSKKIRNKEKSAQFKSLISTYPSLDFLVSRADFQRKQCAEEKSKYISKKQELETCKSQLSEMEGKSAITKVFTSKKIASLKSLLTTLQNQLSSVEENSKAAHTLLDHINLEISDLKSLIAQNEECFVPETMQKLSEEMDNLLKESTSLANDFSCCKAKIEDKSKIRNSVLHNMQEMKIFYKRNPDELAIEYNKLLLQLQLSQDNSTETDSQCIALEEQISDLFRSLNAFDLSIDEGGSDERLFKADAYLRSLENIDGVPPKYDPEKQAAYLEEQISNSRKRINEIEKEIADLEKNALLKAPIVGTTLTKTYFDDVLFSRKFDTVILDEASMAPIPALWLTTYLASSNLVIVGDFKQLSPIVIAKHPMAKKWLGRDIFDHSGARAQCESGLCQDYVIRLFEQFRMHKMIADIANLYYYNMLKSPLEDMVNSPDYKKYCEWYGASKPMEPIGIISTNKLNAWATGVNVGGTKSRLNHLSATLCVKLAFQIVEKLLTDKDVLKDPLVPRVLIMAPYKPHIKRIKQIIDSEYHQRGIDSDRFNLISAGTIHSFQGREGATVIFDLVVDQPHSRCNLFMSGKLQDGDDMDDSLERLFNVAVTRAMYKLIFVGNIEYICSKNHASKTFQLLKYLTEKLKVKPVGAVGLFPKLVPYVEISDMTTPENDTSILVTQSNILNVIKYDILYARKYVLIYSPFLSEKRVQSFLPIFHKAITENGLKIIVVTKEASENKQTMASHNICEHLLKNVGVIISHKYFMHEKIVFIDDTLLWSGSLNLLSYTGNTTEIMERRNCSEIAEAYAKQLQVEYIIGATRSPAVNGTPEELTCPLCHADLRIRESFDGGIYWSCTNVSCKYSRQVDQPYPIDGLIKCKQCGGKYHFAMKKQPRWVCEHNHYQTIRACDLKLPRMLELIPPELRREVERSFSKNYQPVESV